MVCEEAKECVRILLSTCSETELAGMLEDDEFNDTVKKLILERLEVLQRKAGVAV